MKKHFTKLPMFLITISILSVLLSQSNSDLKPKNSCHNTSYSNTIIALGNGSDYPEPEICLL